MRDGSLVELLAEQARPPVLIGAGLALALLIGAGGYVYVIKPSWSEYRELRSTRTGESTRLDAEVRAVDPAEMAALEMRVGSHEDRLFGSSARVSPQEMESHVIDVLDRMSVRHDVDLTSVTPGQAGDVLMFHELPYDVEVSGQYFQLFEWFRDMEASLRPMVVKRFSMAQPASSDRISMKLRLVAYRPAEASS